MAIIGVWRRWIRPLVTLLYVSILLIALPLMIVEFQVHGVEKHLQAWFIGGLFVLMAVPISIWGILQHLIHYTQPTLQRHIVRMLWMVPIYAANAWFALRFKCAARYLDVARECYEAYVIYNFMAFLLCYLKTEYPDLDATIEAKEQVKHLVPICWCPPWPMGRSLITNCKHGVLQYTVIRPLTTIAAFICQLTGVYTEGEFKPTNAWVYIMGINNISQIWAMYCLVLFYKATKEELAPIKPLPKFMCVKAVVFLSFWQSVMIALLVEVGAIKQNPKWDDFSLQDISTGLQDFLICIEMFLAAIAHYYSFSHRPYVDYARGYQNCCQSFTSMWDVSDVRDDVVEHVRHVGKTAQKVVTRPLRGQQPRGTNTERAPLLRESSTEGETYNTYETTPTDTVHPDELYSVLDKTLLDSDNEARHLDGEACTSGMGGLVADNASINTYESSMISDTKSLTTSMNNYAQFSDTSSENFPQPKGKVVGAIVHTETGSPVATVSADDVKTCDSEDQNSEVKKLQSESLIKLD